MCVRTRERGVHEERVGGVEVAVGEGKVTSGIRQLRLQSFPARTARGVNQGHANTTHTHRHTPGKRRVYDGQQRGVQAYVPAGVLRAHD